MIIDDDGSCSSKNDDESSSSSGSEEGWMFLLGGISTELMASTKDWETTTKEENENGKESPGSCHSDKKSTATINTTKAPTITIYDDNDNKYISCHNNNNYDEKIFKRAFKLSTPTNSQIIKPPVKIYNNNTDEGGNILKATKFIPKGETIFTEKAFIGIQVPVPFVVVDVEQDGSRSPSSPSPLSSKEIVIESLYKVRACQNCFKSLEPASCISKDNNLPLSELWPIQEYDNDNYNNNNDDDYDDDNSSIDYIIELNSECNNNNNNNKARTVLHDKSRRVTCQECNTIFCNRYCAQSHLHTMGSCCRYKRAIEGLVMVHHHHNNNIVNTDDDDDDDDDDDLIHKNDNNNEDELEEHDTPTTATVVVDIDPVIILATRMFIAQVQQYRNNSYNNEDNNNSNNASTSLSLSSSSSLFGSLCGEVDDIHSFSLDTCSVVSSPSLTDTDGKKLVVLPFQKEYEIITNAIELTQLERSMTMMNNSSDDDDSNNNESLLLLFSLQSFYKIISIAQRNSISLSTQSPFRTYYQEMIRKSGGRGSDRQQQIVSNIATILGSNDGQLTRNMDKIVEEKCAVSMGGIFTLTAMMNHSCEPNAEIRGGEYVDCNIDIVAKRDIRCGEEITISYLNLGSQNSHDQTSNSIIGRNRRRKELSSRYLFSCQCTRCCKSM